MPYGIEVIKDPTADQYQGLRLNFTGIELLIRYTDGSVGYLSAADEGKFTTEPRWATGAYDNTKTQTGTLGNPFTPLYKYRLYYSEGGKIFETVITVKDVIPIFRPDAAQDNNTSGIKDPVTGINNGPYYVSNGLQITGLGSGKDKMYVDDKPDFAGIVVEADYRKNVNGDNSGTANPGTKKVVPLGPDIVDWRIIPYYNNGKATGRGGLYITVGRNNLDPSDTLLSKNATQTGAAAAISSDLDFGVTAIFPLTEVYHVTGLAVKTEPTLDKFYYWMDDVHTGWTYTTPASATGESPWVARVRKDTVIEATYSDGKTKTFTIPQLEYENTVWKNRDPGNNVEDVTMAPASWQPFDMLGVMEVSAQKNKGTPKAYTKNAAPEIGFYYRGEYAYFPVPVYTTFVRVDIKINDGGEQVEADLRKMDNDYQNTTAAEFGKLITVNAIFTAYAYPDAEEGEYKVSYEGGTNSGNMTQGVPSNKDRYSMDFGQAKISATDATAWGQAMNAKNGAVKAVKVYYANQALSDGINAITSRVRNNSVPVLWTNVPF